MNAKAIFDGLARFDAENQRRRAMRDLRERIAVVGTVCGDCDKWMKSNQCPQERNVNGRNHGPSNGTRKCGQFVESHSATSHRESLNIRLAALQGEAPNE